MKAFKQYLMVCVAIVTTAVLLAMTVQRPPRGADVPGNQRFYVRGEVREIDVAAKSIRLKHEEIPNYMAAMTMPFNVRDVSVLRGLNAGDEVGFELVVTKDDSWIESIHRLSAGPVTDGLQIASPEIQRVEVGEPVPDFALMDQNGRTIHLKDFHGKVILVTFIYTRCPLPNFCPLMSKNFASLQERLQKRFPGKFQLLSVSIDPQFDRPEVLQEYAGRYSKNDSTWLFGTGTVEQSDAVSSLFGLVHERAGGLINHDLRTALIGLDGRLIHVWKSNVWTPYEVQRRVEEILNPDKVK